MAVQWKMDLGVVAEWKQRDELESIAKYQKGDEAEFRWACSLVTPGPWVAICEHG